MGSAEQYAVPAEVVTAPSGTSLKSKLKYFNEKNPEEVKIIQENKDGSIFAHIPVNYIKISPPRKISDEQKEAASKRFKQMWKDKQISENRNNEED